MSFCITTVSLSLSVHLFSQLCSLALRPPPICCLCWFSFSLVHLCSLPCHTHSFSVIFTPLSLTGSALTHLFQQVEIGITKCQWRQREGAEEECHLYIVFILTSVRMWESTAIFGGKKNMWQYLTCKDISTSYLVPPSLGTLGICMWIDITHFK